jgi:hypothetical protein
MVKNSLQLREGGKEQNKKSHECNELREGLIFEHFPEPARKQRENSDDQCFLRKVIPRNGGFLMA